MVLMFWFVDDMTGAAKGISIAIGVLAGIQVIVALFVAGVKLKRVADQERQDLARARQLLAEERTV